MVISIKKLVLILNIYAKRNWPPYIYRVDMDNGITKSIGRMSSYTVCLFPTYYNIFKTAKLLSN